MLRNTAVPVQGWRFRFEDDVWTPITLPHSWNACDALHVGPGWYRRGTGRYTTTLTTPADKRTFLRFGAASQKADVFWNGRKIGHHAGGYLPFAVELPPGETGRLHVDVDNAPDPDLIPSDRSDFFLYGGLTRPVLRYETGPVHIRHVTVVPQLTDEAGLLQLEIDLDGPSSPATRASIEVEGPDGSVIRRTEAAITGNRTAVTLTPVAQPCRWSPGDPQLYNLRLALHHDGDTSDAVSLRFGWRTFDFPAGGPFYLNGERLLLRGTHRHEDWAGCGSAVPEDQTRAELLAIKAAGFNFIRLGHYPQADYVLDLCDELGLIVWEEVPWCRGGVGGARFKFHTRTMLHDMIVEHGRHPSVLFWGLGNELDWESDHPDTTDDDVLAFLRELNAYAHELDPTRLTALRRYDRGADSVDVYSPSIWSGWYRGRYEDYALALGDAQKRHPRLLHVEWGGDSHVGRHNAGPHLPDNLPEGRDHAEVDGLAYSDSGFARASRDGDWSESYMLDLVNWHLQVQQNQPNLAGTAQWAFKDFGTPLRPENPIPYVNQKGLVDRENRPKSVYYLFQAAQTDTPVCRIEAPTWPLRAGQPGENQRVRVITNCATIELFVNGVSAGVRSEGWLRMWQAPFRLGENHLHAVGRTDDGSTIEDRLTQTLVEQAGAPARWLFQAEAVCWRDRPVTRLTVQLADAVGTPCIDREEIVAFQLLGDRGRLLTDLGTPDGSRHVQTANGRASVLFDGSRSEHAILRVTCGGLPPADWNLKQAMA